MHCTVTFYRSSRTNFRKWWLCGQFTLKATLVSSAFTIYRVGESYGRRKIEMLMCYCCWELVRIHQMTSLCVYVVCSGEVQALVPLSWTVKRRDVPTSTPTNIAAGDEHPLVRIVYVRGCVSVCGCVRFCGCMCAGRYIAEIKTPRVSDPRGWPVMA